MFTAALIAILLVVAAIAIFKLLGSFISWMTGWSIHPMFYSQPQRSAAFHQEQTRYEKLCQAMSKARAARRNGNGFRQA